MNNILKRLFFFFSLLVLQFTFSYAQGTVSIPYCQNFDSLQRNLPPPYWNSIGSSITIVTIPYRSYRQSLSIPSETYCITPELDVASLNSLIFSFWLKSNNTLSEDNSLIIYTMTDPNDASTAVPFDTLINTNITDWVFYQIDFSNYTGNAKHIALRSLKPFNIDDVTIEDCALLDFSIINRTTNSATLQFDVIGNPNYIIEYNEFGVDSVITDTISENFYTLTGLTPATTYEVTVKNLCDGSCFSRSVTHTFNTLHQFEVDCFDFTNLSDTNFAIATYGTFHNPFLNIGVVDYGYLNDLSRHTICYIQNEIDPRTISTSSTDTLHTIPEGEHFSVRLGNSSYDVREPQAESITYKLWVDTTESDLLILKYAVVLQLDAAGTHSNGDRPKFNFQITDENGNIINSSCGSAQFAASDSTLQDGISDFYSIVKWKNWTSAGFDLTEYHGQQIFIKLITSDCYENQISGLHGYHFGYAYFTLNCGKKTIKQENCSSSETVMLTAPSGFNYQWTSSLYPDSILSTDQVFTSLPDSSETFTCELISVISPDCSFEIESNALVQYPQARFTFELVSENCEYHLITTNNSFISIDPSGTTPYPDGDSCNYFLWDFGDGRTSTEREPEISYTQPGDYTITLIAGRFDISCFDTTSHTIHIPELPEIYFSPVATVNCPNIGSLDLMATIENIITPYSLVWSFENQLIPNNNITTSPIQILNNIPTTSASTTVIIDPSQCNKNYISTIQVTDSNGCITSDTLNFSISDTTPPAISGSIPLTTIEGCSITNLPQAATTSAELEALGIDLADLCTDNQNLVITHHDNLIQNQCPIIVTRTYTITDECGNSSTISQELHIADNTPPTFTIPNDITIYTDENCHFDTTVTHTGNATNVQDNCSTNLVAHYSDVVVQGDCPGSLTITRTWTLSDDCGNSAEPQTQTITVLDPIKPTFTKPADITIYSDENCHFDTTVTHIGNATNVQDNCSTNIIAHYSDVVAQGDCPGSLTITRTWTLSDDCGNSAEPQTQIITVLDDINPTFTKPADITIYTDGNCHFDSTVTHTGNATNVQDNCSTNLMAQYSDEVAQGDCPGSLTITRTWTLSDDCGNSAEPQTQIITVLDSLKPTFTKPDDITIYSDDNCYFDSTVTHTGNATNVQDNCSTNLMAQYSDEVAQGDCPGSFIITRTWTLSDDCGNSAEPQTQIITVLDSIKPTFTKPDDITIYSDENCHFDSTVTHTGNATNVQDNCSTNLMAQYSDEVAQGDCPGSFIITRTWTLSDDCGNSAEPQTQTITVLDSIKPTFTKPDDITIYTDENCHFDSTVTHTGNATNVQDNCSTNLIAHYSDEVAQGDCPGSFIITRTWTLSDDCGNSAEPQTQIITVLDSMKPIFTKPDDITIYADVNCHFDSTVSHTGNATNVQDNCSSNLIALYSDEVAQGDCPGSFIITRTWTLSDDCGNSAEPQTQIITVLDSIKPTFTKPDDITIYSDDNCHFDTTVTHTGNATNVQDNCSNNLMAQYSDEVAQGDCPGSFIITRTWTLSDDCGNSAEPQTQIITVLDSIKPTFTKPDDITIYSDVNCHFDSTITHTGNATNVQDNCSTDLMAQYSDEVAQGDCIGSFIITRTWTLRDDCGNSADPQTQIITVLDDIKPTFTKPDDITIYSDENCHFDSTVTHTGNATNVQDNCSVNLIAQYSDEVAQGDCPGSLTITRTWTLSDDCGNSAEPQVQIITVLDSMKPTFTKPADITIYSEDNCHFDTTVTHTGNATNVQDNCSSNLIAQYSDEVTQGNCPGSFIITRTWTLSDDCGNSAEPQIQIITINDTIPPTFTAPQDITIYTDDNCHFDSTVTHTGNATNVQDNCSSNLIAQYSDEVVQGDCPGSFIITRTWTLSDDCGNSAEPQTQIITIEDITPPIFTKPDDITIFTDENCHFDTTVSQTGNATNVQDNCSTNLIAQYSDEVAQGNCPGSFIITRTWTLSDDCGNSAEPQTQIITLSDSIKPTFTKPDDITIYTDDNCHYDIDTNNTGIVTDEWDNCSSNLIAQYSDVVVQGDCAGSFIITRTWTLSDDCGNSAEPQVQIITILDSMKPTFTKPADITIFSNDSCHYDINTNNTGNVTDEWDNCSSDIQAVYSDSTIQGDCTGSLTIIRTWTLSDNCGNSAEPQTQTITILDTIRPTFTKPADITIYTDVNCHFDTTVTHTGNATNVHDNCSTNLIAHYSDEVAQGDCIGSFIITRTWTLSDNCGNSAEPQTQIITVLDSIKPTFTKPADITIFTDDNCHYDIDTNNTGNVTDEWDNCSSNIQAHYADSVVNGNCQGTFIIYRTWTLTDSCENSAEPQTQIITVLDSIKPTFTKPDDITIYTDDSCHYDTTLNLTGDVINEWDNCSTNIQAHYSDSVVNGNCQGTYIIYRTWTLTDSCENSADPQTQIITVLDTIKPTFTKPANITIYTDDNCLYDISVQNAGDVVNEWDNCSTDIQATYTDRIVNGNCPGAFTIFRMWRLTDLCHNSSSIQIQVITIKDTIPPTFTRPNDITIYTDEFCMFNIDPLNTGDVLDEADNCTQSLNATYTDSELIRGDCEGAWHIIRTWNLVDQCNNRATPQSQTIYIVDTIAPTFTAPPNIEIVSDDSCNYDISINITGDVLDELDNCSPELEAIFTDSTTIGNCEGDLIIYRTWTLTDSCGNSSQPQTQIITVRDVTPPTFTVPDDYTLYTGNNCLATPAPIITGQITIMSDNCCQTITPFYFDIAGPEDCEGNIIIYRTWSVTDDCDLESVQEVQTITILDTIPPTFTAPPDITIYSDNSCSSITSTDITGDVTNEDDNCSSNIEATFNDVENLGNCIGETIIVRTWQLSDNCGNQAAPQQQLITIKDSFPPTFTTPLDPITLDAENCQFVIPDVIELVQNVTTDNCTETPFLIFEQTPSANTVITQPTQVTITATDDCGNSASIDIQLIIPEQVTINISASDSNFCLGNVTTLTANVNQGTPPYHFEWSTPTIPLGNNNTINITPLTTDNNTYFVTVTDQNGCTNTDEITLQINPIPNTPLITGNTHPNCNQENVQYFATPYENGLFTWDVPNEAVITDGQGSNSIIINLGESNGSIQVSVLDTVTGCNSATGSISITLQGCGMSADFIVTPIDSCLLTNTYLVEHLSTGLSLGSSVYFNFGEGATPSDTSIIVLDTNNINWSFIIHYATAGVKNILLRTTFGLSDSIMKTITVYPNPIITLSTFESTICPNYQPIFINASITEGSADYTVSWSGDGILNSTHTVHNETDSIEVMLNPTLCNNQYNIYAQVVDLFGCPALDTTHFTALDTTPPLLNGNIQNRLLSSSNCTFTIPNFIDSIRLISSDNCTPQSDLIITQNPPEGTVIQNNTTITLTISDLCGNLVETSIELSIPPTLSAIAEAPQTVLCLENSTSLSSTTEGGTPPFEYQWILNQEIVSQSNNFTDVPNAAGQFNYQLLVSDANGCSASDEVTITVNSTYQHTDTVILCDNLLPFIYHNTTYSEAGNYTVPLLSNFNCDSIIQLTLIINPTYHHYDTITIHDYELSSFTYHQQTFSSPGIYDIHLETINGCDSLITLNLIVNTTSTTTISICEDELPYYYGDSIFYEQGVYEIVFNNNNPDEGDSIVTLFLLVHQNYLFISNASIADNQSYTWRNNIYTIEGTYYDSLTSHAGCDSVYQLNLLINPTFQFDTTIHLCSPDTCYWRGNSFTQEGIYYDSLLTVNQSDSVYVLHLFVHQRYLIQESASICLSEPYSWRNINVNNWEAGTYILYDSLWSLSLCDSVYQLTLTINPTYFIQERDTICDNGSLEWHNRTYRNLAAGTYLFYDSLQTINQCDSIYELSLIVTSSYYYPDTLTICDNDSFVWHNIGSQEEGSYWNEGNYVLYDSLQSRNGCDSVFSLYLIVSPSYFFKDTISICDYDSITWHGMTLQNLVGGVYTFTDSLETLSGCDSIFELTLIVNPSFVIHETHYMRDVDTFVWHNLTFHGTGVDNWQSGSILVESGENAFSDSLTTVAGCDSIYLLTLFVNQTYLFSDTSIICNYEEINWRYLEINQWENGVGTFTFYDSLMSMVQCDSVYRLTLIVNPVYYFNQFDTICQNMDYQWRGNTFEQLEVGEHEYYDSLTTQQGCDSIYELHLTVYPTYFIADSFAMCNNDSYLWRGRNFANLPAGYYIYYDSLLTNAGCDSIYQLSLNVYPNYFMPETYSICDNGSYEWRGRNFNNLQAGTYVFFDSLITQHHCDSIYQLTLQVNPTYFFEETVDLCQNETFNWRGHLYDDSTVGLHNFYDSLLTQQGCDSIYHLLLNVHPIYFFSEEHSMCDNEFYEWRGRNFANMQTGTYHYYDSLLTQNHCDSIYRLTLTVHSAYFIPESYAICDNENFEWRGRDLSHLQANTYIFYDSLLSQNQCDSVYQLTLTINPTYLFEEEVEICQNETFAWRGEWYEQLSVGVHEYYDSLTTHEGCDSIYRLSITVNPTYFFNTTFTMCDKEDFQWRGRTFSNLQEGTYHYYDSLFTHSQCDSVYELILIVHPTYFNADTITICNHQSVNWRNIQIYDWQNGAGNWIYWDSLVTEAGCDSVYRLTLFVSPTYYFADSIGICQNESFVWRGNIYEHLAVGEHHYYDSLTTQQGCDSVYYIKVSVHPTYFIPEAYSMCDNENYAWRGSNITNLQAGTYIYYDSLQTLNHCDSIYQLTLHVHATFFDADTLNICNNDALHWRNIHITNWQQGVGTWTYYDSLLTPAGCDSVYRLTLNVHPTYYFETNIEICDNEQYQWRSHHYENLSAGSYTNQDNLNSVYGCDSIYHLNLTVLPTYNIVIHDTTCQGEGYYEYGFEIDPEDIRDIGLYSYQQHLSTTNGCDSIINLTLKVNPISNTQLFDTICQGEVYTLWGFNLPVQDEVGTFNHQLPLTNIYQCDSIVLLSLTINPIYEVEFMDYACQGEPYQGNGFTIQSDETQAPGTRIFTRNLQTIYNCDSIINLTLNIVDISVSIHQLTEDFCEENQAVLIVESELPNYEWNTGNIGNEIVVTNEGTYSVTASGYGCSNSAEFTIPICEMNLFFPNTITPSNEDGLNDYFCLSSTNQVKEIEVYIYNRWGGIIYESNDINFKWDGKIKGERFGNYVFTYLIKVKPRNGATQIFTGKITVL